MTTAGIATTPSTRPWLLVVLGLVVVLAATIPFLPAMQGGFIDYDDHGFVLEADQWRGLGPANLVWMFTTFRLGHYQPLTYLSYAIDYTLFGLEPAAFHATNILLHAVSAVLVLMLTRRVLVLESARGWASSLSDPTRSAVAAAVAAIWAIHPLRVESVAWITERRDVLSCALLLGAALAYLQHGSSGERPMRGRYWWICLGLLSLSILAKAWGMTFFAVALLLDVRPLGRLAGSPRAWWNDAAKRAVLIEKTPLLAVGLLSAVLAAGAVTDTGARSLTEWGVPERIAQAAYGVCFYVQQTVLPTRLSLLHELPSSIKLSQAQWLAPIVLVILSGAGLAIVGRRRVGLVVAVACYIAIISPVLGLAQSGIQLVADRYAHLATIPLFVLAAAGIAGVLSSTKQRAAAGALIAAALVVLPLLGTMTWRQSSLWRSDALLWQDAINRGIDGPLLRGYFASHLEGKNRLKEAEAQYLASIKLNDQRFDSWFGLGSVLNKQGRYAESAAALQHAATITDNPAKALMMLGIVNISKLNKPAEAIAAFRAAVEVTDVRGNPERTGRPYLLLAAALGKSGDVTSAIPLLKKAAEFPDSREEARGHLNALGVKQ